VAACLPLAPAVRPAAATVVRLAIDPAASSLTFTVSRPGETVEGSAAEFSGEVRYDPGDPARSEVTLTVRAASMRTGNRIRDRRMRGIHLEVGKHPEIVFRSTAIRVGEAGRKALLEGILDLHGVERTILFPAAIRYDNGSLAAEGELVLRLSDHGIPIPRFLWMVLDDEVRVRFRLRAMPRGAGD
jgi:polyisoprenoid-binding protein YceI